MFMRSPYREVDWMTKRYSRGTAPECHREHTETVRFGTTKRGKQWYRLALRPQPLLLTTRRAREPVDSTQDHSRGCSRPRSERRAQPPPERIGALRCGTRPGCRGKR